MLHPGKLLPKILYAIVTSFIILREVAGSSISGQVKEQESGLPVAFATVSLFTANDSTFITGTVSGDDGRFKLERINAGRYLLRFSYVGYETERLQIDIKDKENEDVGTVFLREGSVNLQEAVVKGKKLRAKAGGEGVTYFVNKSMLAAAASGTDVLKFIPGIQFDFTENMSFEGSQNILIMVDGKVRDTEFIRQLEAGRINRIEVISHPGPAYDANVSGVINIITKQQQTGFDGYVKTEIPVDRSVVYMFPSCGLNYGSKSLNLYTSYTGEISRLPIVENTISRLISGKDTSFLYSKQHVMQNNRSHRFNFGIDYMPGDRDRLNLYGFYNPYSNEYSGSMTLGKDVNGQQELYLPALKTDDDHNQKLFGSVYYKHLFHRPGTEFSLDAAYYYLDAYNATTYSYREIPGSENAIQSGLVRPVQHSLSTKADFSTVLNKHFSLHAGLKGIIKSMADRQNSMFRYRENVLAAYSSITFKYQQFQLDAGIRNEQSGVSFTGHFTNHYPEWIPSVSMQLHLAKMHTLSLSYRKAVYRPTIYQLNPAVSYDDLFSVRRGNPELGPGYNQKIYLGYSVTRGANFLSAGFFYERNANVISSLLHVNQDGNFETKTFNAGNIRSYGFRLSGALKPAGFLSMNPYLKVYEIHTFPGRIADEYGITEKKDHAVETGLSAIATFGRSSALGLRFQYNRSGIGIQGKEFSDALYFLSLEKSINKRFKVGIVSGLPFKRTFIYQGMDIQGLDFSRRYHGDVILPAVPFWFSVHYQFKSGKKVTKISREKETIDATPRRGF